MSEFPYADEQVEQFHAAAGLIGDDSLLEARSLLADLHGAGITVRFPKLPRFYAVGSHARAWRVLDRCGPGGMGLVASFDRSLDTHAGFSARGFAMDLAARLNVEVSA